ncbi:ABC transporter ATP-binding protein [Clostridium estertheticum]|uniref:ABC transporter ATP-binding protein n=1 Tax=Clostridium estertheticum TaxID=238834 RepID=UPI001C0AF398|nr:ABC transporter ATP-binding protein [Clostridium estertheticum]MBU3201629.1 ABC transporter ATP-binding protein [Clostridium estertheticum]WAG67871.1 ABC transporter ATP-binding protein [Clostridium estertheticum]
MVVLNVNDLKKIYTSKKNISKTNALNGINLKIEQGEFVGIMGPSGSGKTTLLNILSGIDNATSGKIEILGQDINKMSKNSMTLFRRNNLGYVFQEFNLLDSLTIEENIMLPLSFCCDDLEELNKKIKNIMNMLDIEGIKNQYPYSVSGGEQQRTAIGRAIINDPNVIFADEPTGNLDSKSSNIVMQYFEKLNITKKNTIVVVTHDPFTASYCNRIIFIKDGLVNSEITKSGTNRKMFFGQIMEKLTVLGGNDDEFQANFF